MLVEISNIFNLLVEQPNSGFKFYHYGYRVDINREIDNNYDVGNKFGRMYPSVQMDVPDQFTAGNVANLQNGNFNIPIRLYFDDLLSYDNQGQTKTLNLIEVQESLGNKANVLIQSFIDIVDSGDISMLNYIDGPITLIPRANLGADGNITIECNFTLNVFAGCINPNSKIVIDPTQVISQDIERVKR